MFELHEKLNLQESDTRRQDASKAALGDELDGDTVCVEVGAAQGKLICAIGYTYIHTHIHTYIHTLQIGSAHIDYACPVALLSAAVGLPRNRTIHIYAVAPDTKHTYIHNSIHTYIYSINNTNIH